MTLAGHNIIPVLLLGVAIVAICFKEEIRGCIRRKIGGAS